MPSTFIHRFRPLLLVFVLALLASACGGADDGGRQETEAGGGEQSEATEPPETEEPMALTEIDFLLNFRPYPADHAYFSAGIDQGIFEAHGIDLTLVAGTGSGDALSAVGVGRYPMALLDTGTMMLGIANQNIPIKSLGVLNQRSPMAVIFMTEKGYQSLDDLRGETIASSQGGSLTRIFPAVLTANDMSEADVDMAYVGSGESQQVAMLSGQADAFLGYFPDDGMTLRLEDHDVDWIPFADMGVNLLNLGIGANTDWLATHPDVAAEFIAAVQESIEWTIANPEQAAEIFSAEYPDAGYSPEDAVEMMKVSFELLHTDNSADLPYLMSAEEDWQATQDLLIEYSELEAPGSLSAYYTLQYVPTD